MISDSHQNVVLKLLVFVVLGVVIYSNALEVPFYFDDLRNIKYNPNIRLMEGGIDNSPPSGFSMLASNRPTANISFALNYYFHGTNVIGYHVVNVIIHVLTGLFFYALLSRTLSISIKQPLNGPTVNLRSPSNIAFFAALIWLVHPIQTQSVTYVVQRMNSMAGMFYVLSLLLYVKGRQASEQRKGWPWFLGCAVSGILAMGSKQIAATLPVFILLYEWYFLQDLRTVRIRRAFLWVAGLLLFFGLLALGYLGSDPLDKILSGYGKMDFTATQRVLTQFRVVIFYASLLVFPHPSRLNLDHDFALSHSLIDPVTTFLSMGVLVGLIALAFFLAKTHRLASFAIIWFLGNLIIESSIIGLEIIYEHRTYLPSMFFVATLVVLASRHIRRDWVLFGGFAAVILLLCLWTHERNSVWKEPIDFWKDCADKSEKKARPNYNLANALARRNRLKEAAVYYYNALRIEPNKAHVHSNLGNVLAGQGKLDEAVFHYFEALRINPDLADTHYNLGNALARQGKLDQAIAQYSEALRIEPGHRLARGNLEVVLAKQGKSELRFGQHLEKSGLDSRGTTSQNAGVKPR